MKTVIILLPGANVKATQALFPLLKERLSKKYLVEEVYYGVDDVNLISVNQALDKFLSKIKELKNKGFTEFIFIGKSFGGFIAMLYQLKFPEAKAIVLLAPAVYALEDAKSFQRLNEKLVSIDLTDFTIPTKYINACQTPILLVHALDDDVMKFENSEKLAKLFQNVKLVKISKGGHSYRDMESKVTDKIEQWIQSLK